MRRRGLRHEGAMRMNDRAKGIAAITASAFGFALMAACVRLADDYGSPISSFQKSFFRNVVALAIAFAVFIRRGLSPICGGLSPIFGGLSPKAAGLLILRSLLGTCGIFANFYALGLVPIADGQTLNKTAPFFTVAFVWLFSGEKASMRQVVALAFAFAGVVFVAKPGFAGDAAFPLAMGLVGGACAGGAYACVRALRRHAVEPAFIVLFFSAFSCVASVPFMLSRFDPMTVAQVAILFGAGAGAAIGQFGITLAYGYAAPRDIAVYDYSNILFTAAFGLVLFGQVPDVWSVLGFSLILVAAFRLNRP